MNIHAAYPEFAKTHKTDIDGLLLNGMHPNELGHQLVAEQLMSALQSQIR